MPPDTLGILLISAGYERAHYAFVLASGAAAIGRDVILFATNQGCRALLADLTGLTANHDAALQAIGVAGLADLRDACIEMGVRLIACEAGLRIANLETTPLAQTVQIAGIVTFLEAARGQLLTL